MVDIFQPDVNVLWGFTSFYELAAVATMHNVAMAPPTQRSALCRSGIQAIASIRNGRIFETVGNEAEEELAAQLLINPEVVG